MWASEVTQHVETWLVERCRLCRQVTLKAGVRTSKPAGQLSVSSPSTSTETFDCLNRNLELMMSLNFKFENLITSLDVIKFLNLKLRQPLKVLSPSGTIGTKSISVYNFPARQRPSFGNQRISNFEVVAVRDIKLRSRFLAILVI